MMIIILGIRCGILEILDKSLVFLTSAVKFRTFV